MRTLRIFVYLSLFLVWGCMNFSWDDGVLPCDDSADCPPGMVCGEPVGTRQMYCFRPASMWTDTGTESIPEDTEYRSDVETDTLTADSGSQTYPIDTQHTDSETHSTGSSDTDSSGTDTPTETGSDTPSESDTSTCECLADSDCMSEDAGNCAVGHCEVDSRTFTCTYSMNVGRCVTQSSCAAPTCVDLAGRYDCQYTIDPEGCEPGEVCDPTDEFTCQPGVCVENDTDTDSVIADTRLTSDNQGIATPDMAAMAPSVVSTGTGFAAVYAPAQVSKPDKTYVYTYKKLKFARFDASGNLLGPGWSEIATNLGFNHPVLLSLGSDGGFAVVYQYWANEAHEIGLIELDAQGNVVAGPILMSAVDGRYSFWPDASFNSASGPSGRVVVAFLDTRDDSEKPNSNALIDVYSVVYDVETNSVVGSESRLCSTQSSEKEVATTSVPGGFLVAGFTSGANSIWTRFVSDGGTPEVLDSPRYVTQGGSATRPLALACDGDRVALAWRSGNYYRIGLLDVDGTTLAGETYIAGVPLGPALSASENLLSHYGKTDLFWNPTRGAFGVCYDSVPGTNNGPAAQAAPMLAYASMLGEDGLSAQTSYRLGEPDTLHSLAPSCAVNGDTNLVLWNDNRDEPVADSWQGDIYGATITCE